MFVKSSQCNQKWHIWPDLFVFTFLNKQVQMPYLFKMRHTNRHKSVCFEYFGQKNICWIMLLFSDDHMWSITQERWQYHTPERCAPLSGVSPPVEAEPAVVLTEVRTDWRTSHTQGETEMFYVTWRRGRVQYVVCVSAGSSPAAAWRRPSPSACGARGLHASWRRSH